ncbi:MAG: hypothetical protein M1827_000754 [Pycnora praestabilis]|nr:MAG: hypothetical protein M1827_000754 [Pycnora praestabilis]
MSKRKRDVLGQVGEAHGKAKRHATATAKACANANPNRFVSPATIQIITGSYDRVLHGITATIAQPSSVDSSVNSVAFADTFLFDAHTSAIRCLALSPPSTSKDSSHPQKVILASGSTDERINLYHLSATPPAADRNAAPIPTLAGRIITEDPKNRELGSLLHHSSTISALHFPTRSKLLSAAEDNTIAVTRTRDWTVLSSIKAPIPKALGRPSGDTAPLGGAPAGVNDFAVHPSMKLMVSVGKGEKCMRLWNLVTGKKASVLNFGKEILQGVEEGRWGSGEGRKVEWNGKGEEFVVGFERGAVVFGLDSKPRARILPSPLTKIHQFKYVPSSSEADKDDDPDVLAVSTEDGKIIFYSTTLSISSDLDSKKPGDAIPKCPVIGQLSSSKLLANGNGDQQPLGSGRIKDFEIMRISSPKTSDGDNLIIVAGSSDGAVRLWTLGTEELPSPPRVSATKPSQKGSIKGQDNSQSPVPLLGQIGQLLGTYKTDNRITCLKAFVMLDRGVEGDADNDGARGTEGSELDGESGSDGESE